jgi:uncharacterized protein YecT (DUF1311 family)
MLRHAVLLYVCMTSAAHACGDEVSAALDEAEQNLQGAYERAWSGAEEERREFIVRSQIAWRDYRGANCEMYASRGAWISQNAYEQCLKYMTEERTQDLRLVCLTGGGGLDCQP